MMLDYNAIDGKSREHLDAVLSVMRQFNIDAWLDGGTLLGVVRDKKFIPWDWDVDLSAWYGDWYKDPKLIQALNDAGFAVVHLNKSYSIRLEPKDKYYGWRLIDIHMQRKQDCHATTCYYEFNHSNKVQAWLFRIIMWLDKHQQRLSKEHPSLKSLIPNPTKKVNSRNVGKLRLVASNIISKIKHSIFMFRFVLFAKTRTLKTPVKFFTSFENLEFSGNIYPVPAKPENYLAFKYGNAWSTPLQSYDWRNDGAVQLGGVEAQEAQV